MSDHDIPHVENDVLEELLPPLSPLERPATGKLIDCSLLLLDPVDNHASEQVRPTAPR